MPNQLRPVLLHLVIPRYWLRILYSSQIKIQANPSYMTYQKDITYNMRAVLVDWLVEVADEFRMDDQTLYVTVG